MTDFERTEENQTNTSSSSPYPFTAINGGSAGSDFSPKSSPFSPLSSPTPAGDFTDDDDDCLLPATPPELKDSLDSETITFIHRYVGLYEMRLNFFFYT